MVLAEEKRADLEAAESRKREEVSFKVESALPDITVEDPVATLEAFDKFERVLDEARIMDYRTWLKFLRHKLKGNALRMAERRCLGTLA